MYKLLLCWRYLCTRYIALASIISVTLGVATMIVVNAVMAGFTHEMQDRIHGILSDLVFESRSLNGAPDANAHMERIRRVAGEHIAGMSPTVHVPAMLGYKIGEQYRTQQINLIGIDEATYADVSDFGRYLQHPANRDKLTFDLRDGGYDTVDHQAEDPAKAPPRKPMESAGWRYRRWKNRHAITAPNATAPPPELAVANPFDAPGASAVAPTELFNPLLEQHTGCVLGIALASYRDDKGVDTFLQLPGDDVEITYPSAGRPPKPLSAHFTVVDFYESKMNEYDTSFAFVPLQKMQELRGMIDPATGVANFNTIQIRLNDDADPELVRDLIRKEFPDFAYAVSTWRDKQGALLAAVQMETAVLNVLLFLIIAVAGFGILAIFYMIVVEKTRDIGILKSLGASGGGVMGIFTSYGLLLGVVGAGAGVIGGLLFVHYINEIADLLAHATGRPVFDPSIYYFQSIPAIVHPWTVAWVALGAMAIAILASVLPARRASAMHPVSALRWE
ncbi:MAG: FtsX-like permease family protein [Planctomycetota bacterium]